MADVSDYTALLTGDYWGGIEITDHPVFVTYSFDTTAPASDASHLAGSAYATFTPFTAAQQAEAQQALANWGTNSGIVFLQAAPGQGDINFAAYDFSSDPNFSGAGGVGYYPFGNWDYATFPYFAADNPGSGNILMNTAFENNGTFALPTVLHEIGHALGLKEPDQAWTDTLTSPQTVHNVWDPSVPIAPTVMVEGQSTLTAITTLDIQAIQAIYGTPAQQASMDSSWTWNATTDTLTQHLTNAASLEVRGVSTNNVIFAGSGSDTIFAVGAGSNTVYAGTGNDTIVGGSGKNLLFAGKGPAAFDGTFGPTTVDYARAPAGVSVNLANPSLDTGWATGNTFTNVHSLIGSNFADTLTADNALDTIHGGAGNDVIIGGSGKDFLYGDAGNDTLIAGTGGDLLTGGAGADRFVFPALADSTVAASGRATITDFSSAQGDQIDLSGIAAATGQTLSFIGSAAFDGHPGEVRAVAAGTNTLVSLDANGDKRADFAILLKGPQALTAGDFILSPGTAAVSAAASSPWLGAVPDRPDFGVPHFCDAPI